MNNITTYNEFLSEKFNLKNFLIKAGIFANFVLLPNIMNAGDPMKKGVSASSNVYASIVEPATSDTTNINVNTKIPQQQRHITMDGKNITINYE